MSSLCRLCGGSGEIPKDSTVQWAHLLEDSKWEPCPFGCEIPTLRPIQDFRSAEV